MVKLGFDFVVKLKGFATVSQKVLECNFMLMSPHLMCFVLTCLQMAALAKKKGLSKNSYRVFNFWKEGSISFSRGGPQRKCCPFCWSCFFPKLQFSTMFNENHNICEDINVKLHSNTFCETVAKPFNLITKSKPSLTIKSSLCI